MLEVGDLAGIEVILVSVFADDGGELGKEFRVFVPLEHILMWPGLRVGLGEDPRGGGEEGGDMWGKYVHISPIHHK